MGYVWEVSWRLNKTATYWHPALLAIAALLSYPAGLLSLSAAGSSFLSCWRPSSLSLCSWFSRWHLISKTATTDPKPTDSKLTELPVAPGYIIVWRPPASCGHHICTQFNRLQSTLSPDIFDRIHQLFTQVHFFFDSSAGSEINMLQLFSVVNRTLIGRGSYPSAEMQSMYSTAPANWAV